MKTTKKTPFDIEKAKNGATIVDGNNNPITILKYDLRNKIYPIVGLVSYSDGTEDMDLYTIDGQLSYVSKSEDEDLYILEETEEFVDFETITHETIATFLDSDKVRAVGRLFMIADYYNKQDINWNNQNTKYHIFYNNDYKGYCITGWSGSNYGTPYFINQEDAQSVIDNPNFKPILDTIFK